MCNFESLSEDNPNGWFHEALCELAAVFTLRRMAERWPVNPPYRNWATYAASLAEYVDELLHQRDRQLPLGMTLPDWLVSWEATLRTNRYQRSANATAAYLLLPILEDEPEGWNTVAHLPNSRGLLVDYIVDWALWRP